MYLLKKEYHKNDLCYSSILLLIFKADCFPYIIGIQDAKFVYFGGLPLYKFLYDISYFFMALTLFRAERCEIYTFFCTIRNVL